MLIITDALGTIHKGLLRGTGITGNVRTCQAHRNYIIVEIGQNTEESLANLKIHVFQTPVKDSS